MQLLAFSSFFFKTNLQDLLQQTAKPQPDCKPSPDALVGCLSLDYGMVFLYLLCSQSHHLIKTLSLKFYNKD